MTTNEQKTELNIPRTGRMYDAKQSFDGRDDHRRNAKQIEHRLQLRELEHPELAGLRLGKRIIYVALCLLLLAPLIPDPVLLYPAITDLLKSNLGVTDTLYRVIFTIGFVVVQVYAVWALAHFGRTKRGFTGLFLAAVGLVIAAAIPVIAASTALAQATVSGLEPLMQLNGLSVNAIQAPGASTLWSAAKENMHLIMLCVFSLAFHSLIWAFAGSIAEAIEAVPILWMNYRDKAMSMDELVRAEESEREARRILEQLFNQDEILRHKWNNVRFIREPWDDRIAAWHEEWRQRKRTDTEMESPAQEPPPEEPKDPPKTGNVA